MVDTRTSLVFSLRNNPGRYALLLGSGVSTEAGIPTGWTVISNLAKRVAASEGTTIDDDTEPPNWYEETYNESATYENLIVVIESGSNPEVRSFHSYLITALFCVPNLQLRNVFYQFRDLHST